ncbi:MAG: septum formation initiator family protein [Candidatus Marinimicrobia bacterium]|nr:septum formation initiator family protein [Candidatus Neomarinimicrobiota bacterium]
MARKVKNINDTNWSLLIWSSAFMFFIIHLVFNDLGLVKMFELKSKRNELIAEIQKLELEIIEQTETSNRLKYDYEYIENIARKRFRMVKKGEKVYRVRDERTIK